MDSALVEFNWDPSKRQLRQFGVLCFVIFPLLGWLWNVEPNVNAWLFVIGVLIAVLSFTCPYAVKSVFLGLTLMAAPFGLVVGELAMLLLFLGVFLPMHLIFRLMGRDALRLKKDKNKETYWQAKREPNNAASYYRQF